MVLVEHACLSCKVVLQAARCDRFLPGLSVFGPEGALVSFCAAKETKCIQISSMAGTMTTTPTLATPHLYTFHD